jgi:hypothetical protein
MSTARPLAKAHEAIGAFFSAFSKLDREVGETLKVVLRLKGNAAADAIVAAVGDFAKKATIVSEAVQTAKRPDGTDPEEAWKSDAAETLKQIFGCNNPVRRDLAHSYLDPQADGSVILQRPGGKPELWTDKEFDQKIANMNELAKKLKDIRDHLTDLNIPVPTGWMSIDTYQPRRPTFNPAVYMPAMTGAVPLPIRDASKSTDKK